MIAPVFIWLLGFVPRPPLSSHRDWNSVLCERCRFSGMESLRPYEHQTAGHSGALVKQDDEWIWKLSSSSEVKFYQNFYQEVTEIQAFAPLFHSVKQLNSKNYLILEDLTHRYKKPNICDIKMGTTSVADDATPEKRATMSAKDRESTTATLGVRISGCRIYDAAKEEYIVRDKKWGKAITSETIRDALALFFNKTNIRVYLPFLERLLGWMERQTHARFISSSLLFLWEGAEGDNPVPAVAKMIDFAHVYAISDGGRDESYIFGLRTLISLLKGLL
eukprot:TRINITY_DN31301_c0_g1_i1.p1 TRINITY_DN31301_c0_g1~~TRINITY_DN31301_c0_g1_i1.p1  ORF type:complete len:277 (+),score=16.83 TRINITY_DN31301_c0_g1_i1:58-888(+)